MSVAAVQTFFGILALAAIAAVIGVVVVRLLAAVLDDGRRRWEGLVGAVAPGAFAMAWLVAFLATAGSLYFSEVAGYEPCRLCWYQRIAMYPLVVLLAIAAARRERAGAYYAAGLAIVGAIVSGYHVVLEWFPSLDSGACSATTPCTLIWFRVFGFISLPTLALTAFALILALLAIRLSAQDGGEGIAPDDHPHDDHDSDPGGPNDPAIQGIPPGSPTNK